MIQVTLEFDNISEAHAALGNMMARMTTPSASVVEFKNIEVQPGPVVEEPKPKRKRGTGKPTGRPKGSKDGPGVVRKGTKAAGEGLTIEQVQSKLSEYANEHGFKAARDVLTKHNVKRVSELPQDRWFKLMGDLNQAPKEEEKTA